MFPENDKRYHVKDFIQLFDPAIEVQRLKNTVEVINM